MGDLTKKKSLVSVKQWYKQARAENKHAVTFLIGAKWDLYDVLPDKEKEEITKQARKFAKAMKAPLIYCSAQEAINVKKIFQIIISKVFNVPPKVREIHHYHEPILEFASKKDMKSKKKKKKANHSELVSDTAMEG